ncbi:unnamed protein product [Peniophora sp. CBMAI 1063]|nr:unnamed protein product [Peniophora sp. CBMAI 1063]
MVLDKDLDKDMKLNVSEDDAPPSYQSAVAAAGLSSSATPTISDAKAFPPSPGLKPPKSGRAAGGSASPRKSGFFRAVSSIFDTPSKQVRATTQALVRDVVQRAPGAPALSLEEAEGVLESCAAACAAKNFDLGSILREPFIEQHTAIYWAILAGNEPLARILLERSGPLSFVTADEVRCACTLASDDALWRRLRSSYRGLEPELSPEQALILSGARDEVTLSSSSGSFVASMRLPHFQKRMRATGRVSVDCIAHGRLFRISFIVNKSTFAMDHNFSEGAWLLGISLQPPSTPTPVYARLLVGPQTSAATRDKRPGGTASVKQKPLNLSISTSTRGSEQELAVAPRWGHEVRAELPNGVLQDDGSIYIDEEGTLRAGLETQLQKPASENDCIIC